MNANDRKPTASASISTPAQAAATPAGAYRAPEVHRLGNLDQIQGTSYGNTYDGVYTTRSWWYTS